MDEFVILPPLLGLIIGAVLPIIAIGSWLGAVAAAWQHRREQMAVLIGIAMIASAATLAFSLTA